MFKQLFHSAIASVVHAATGIALAHVTGDQAEQKLTAAVAYVEQAIDGIAPGWAVPIINAALPKLVQALYEYAKQSGLLEKLVEELAQVSLAVAA